MKQSRETNSISPKLAAEKANERSVAVSGLLVLAVITLFCEFPKINAWVNSIGGISNLTQELTKYLPK